MTDRVKGFIVTLEKDVRIDDVELIMQTIRFMRGISDVQPSIADVNDHIIEMRVKNKLREKLYEFLKDNF